MEKTKWFEETPNSTSAMRVMCMMAFVLALLIIIGAAVQTIFYGDEKVLELTWQMSTTLLVFAITGKVGQKIFGEK